jgi:short subunit dehydrogenase-like uncharacterized protein
VERPFDLVLFGATGFTGRRAARLLAPLQGRWRIALAARDPERLERLARPLGLATLQADAGDPASLAALARSTRVVASCAGPFARHSNGLLDACVEAGTHWCDLTGETAWVRRVIDRHHARCSAEGIRVVPFCGFDSIPADTAVARLEEEAAARWGEGLARVEVAWSLKGGLNGGTLASAREVASSGDWRGMADPMLLCPGSQVPRERSAELADRAGPFRARLTGRWLAPFLMGPVDVRVVRRTRLLTGRDPSALAHREGQDLGGGWPRAVGGAGLLLGVGALLLSRPGRALFRALSPAPGEGPSPSRVESGFTRAIFTGVTESGRRLVLRLDADGDASNAVTVRCLLVAAELLLEGHGPGQGGVLTPVAAFGPELLRRLEATGAHRVRVQEGEAQAG